MKWIALIIIVIFAVILVVALCVTTKRSSRAVKSYYPGISDVENGDK